MTQLPVHIDLDDVLRQIRNSLLLHPSRSGSGAVKIVIESDTGEQLTVLKVDARSPPPTRPALPLGHRVVHSADSTTATSSVQRVVAPVDKNTSNWEQQHTTEGLLQRCNEQQQRIAELEQRLQQAQQELHHPGRPLPPAAPSADRAPLCPELRTDDDDSSSASNSASSSNDSPLRSSGGETDEDGHEANDSTVPMTDGEEEAAQLSSSSPPGPPASENSTAVRRSERSRTNVHRWRPPTQRDAPCRTAEPTSSRKKRKTNRHHRARLDDGEHSLSLEMESMEVDSSDAQSTNNGADDDDAVEVAALVAKLREGYDRRESVALDSLCKPSLVSLCQQVLDEEGDRILSISGRITSLITTSTSLKMVGYYLRAILAHRLKFTSQNCYKRLARDTLGIKSPADIAAYPALYGLVQHHFPTLASAGIEVWLENPIFSADITWTEWKRYLTKQGRPIIDTALQQFKASVAPFQDWMELGWVEIYDDEKLGGQGVRALRDINMPTSKAKAAQRDVAASTSVVAADLHCCSPEFVLSKDTTGDADPTYLVQLDRQRVFDARRHWIGKINHLPDRLCNIRLTSSGKLVQIKPIAAGDALTFDYDVDYWVYQLSGLELSEWSAGSSIESSRGTLDLFRRMHSGVLDYTDLLRCDWVKRRPAVWSELERESWMGDLAEYLEDAGYKDMKVVSAQEKHR